jgi:hypothetical protein
LLLTIAIEALAFRAKNVQISAACEALQAEIDQLKQTSNHANGGNPTTVTVTDDTDMN